MLSQCIFVVEKQVANNVYLGSLGDPVSSAATVFIAIYVLEAIVEPIGYEAVDNPRVFRHVRRVPTELCYSDFSA